MFWPPILGVCVLPAKGLSWNIEINTSKAALTDSVTLLLVISHLPCICISNLSFLSWFICSNVINLKSNVINWITVCLQLIEWILWCMYIRTYICMYIMIHRGEHHVNVRSRASIKLKLYLHSITEPCRHFN